MLRSAILKTMKKKGLCQMHGASRPDNSWTPHAAGSAAFEVTRSQGSWEHYSCHKKSSSDSEDDSGSNDSGSNDSGSNDTEKSDSLIEGYDDSIVFAGAGVGLILLTML